MITPSMDKADPAYVKALEEQLAALTRQLETARTEITQLNEKLTAALDGTGLCIWQGEIQSGKLTVFNLQDFAAGEMAPCFDRWQSKLHPQDKEATLSSYYTHLAGQSPCYEAEYRTIQPDGKITWLWDRGRIIERDNKGAPVRIMGAHIDISRRKAYEQQLADLAHIDPLTGLANRRQLREKLQQETERSRRYGEPLIIAMIDVDHFKKVNDTYGHDLGDQVLQEVTQHINGMLREYDTCGRWGGEEFLLLIPNTTMEDALKMIQRLHHDIQRTPITLQQIILHLTVSIGVAEYCYWENYSDTINRADNALLEAKRQGRNCVLSATNPLKGMCNLTSSA